MTARLTARLLGRASFSHEGREVVPRSRKAADMLAYLCLNPEGASRAELAEMFWDVGKLANVRQALYELRRLSGAADWLEDERDPIRVAADTDVGEFTAALDRGDSAAALAVYGGRLLHGELDLDAPRFREWLTTTRDWLDSQHLAALVSEAARLEADGRLGEARQRIDTAIAIDQLEEELYRSGMRLNHALGDSPRALQLYRLLVARLEQELGEEPDEQTRVLADAIERGEALDLHPRPELLPAERLRLLQAVAMGDGALGVHGTAAVLELGDIEVAEGMAALQRGGWLDAHLNVPTARAAEVIASIAPAFRRLLHERIAAVLGASDHADDAVIARHQLAASNPRAAAPHFIAAARAAVDRAALDDASTYLFQAAWAACTDLPEVRLEAYSLLEGVASQRGDEALQEAALAAAESLATELQDDAKLADVRLRRSRQRLTQGRVGEGMDLALQALEIATRTGDSVTLARARNAVGAAHYYAGDLDGAAEIFANNLEAEDLIERYRAYSNLASLAAMRGASEEAYGRFESALTLARAIGPKADVAATLNNLAATADRMGEYGKAVRHFREGIAVSRRNQALDREGRMLTNLAAVYARQGQLGPSWNTAAEVEELAESIAAPRLKLSAIELKADVQRLCGMLAQACASLSNALSVAAQLEDERKALTLTAQLRTVEALVSGDFSEAETAIGTLDAERLTDNAPWLWFDLALAARDAEQALGYVRRVSIEGRLAHHRVVADIATMRAALLAGADAACRQLAAEATDRLARTLDAHEIVERPLGRLLLGAGNGHAVDVGSELADQGAGLPRALRESLNLQPGAWLSSLTLR